MRYSTPARARARAAAYTYDRVYHAVHGKLLHTDGSAAGGAHVRVAAPNGGAHAAAPPECSNPRLPSIATPCMYLLPMLGLGLKLKLAGSRKRNLRSSVLRHDLRVYVLAPRFVYSDTPQPQQPRGITFTLSYPSAELLSLCARAPCPTRAAKQKARRSHWLRDGARGAGYSQQYGIPRTEAFAPTSRANRRCFEPPPGTCCTSSQTEGAMPCLRTGPEAL